MNYIKDTKLKNTADSYNMIIEIPKGTSNKYELVDGSFDRIECVRKVIGKYPFYYGCFPRTHAGDKDPLDAILLSNRKRKILDIVDVQVIGVIKTIDNGEQDDKILVIASDEPIQHLDKLESKALKFLGKYKGKHANTQIDFHIYDDLEALKCIQEASNCYIKLNNMPNGLKSF